MRTEEISIPIPEESHAVFKLVFKNERNIVITPISIYWDILGKDSVILAYNQIASVVGLISYIELSPEHTRIQSGECAQGNRILNLRIRYLSILGGEKVLNYQYKFYIQDLRLVGYAIGISVVDTIFTDDYVRDINAD